MANKSVIVLAANGRRQTVKVTPNTTVLQVLEEVCSKQGFKAEEYDLKHHNKVLDVTSTMRYSGLPNNAQLEMATALKSRAETSVKVGLALESGNRVMGEFEPSESLWHVLGQLCPNEVDIDESSGTLPIVFYLGREECGKENLERTTLRNLGLTSGGAILRYFRKAPGEFNQQANVSAPLTRPITAKDTLDKPVLTSGSTTLESQNVTAGDLPQKCISQQLVVCESIQTESEGSVAPQEQLSLDKSESIKETVSPVSSREKCTSDSGDIDMDYESGSGSTTQVSLMNQSALSVHEERCSEMSSAQMKNSNGTEETIIFLGERNAVLFDVATARACKPEDVPDDFFDLTVDDAKQLLRDLKRRQAALEEQPLVTSQYRELEKSKHMLSALHQYKRCVIKVQFPNQLVLQGTFTPLEKVSNILDFVRKYLQDQTTDFQLVKTPPKSILQAEQTLYDADCVPGALIHFLSSAQCPENGSYIHEDIMAQACSASAAAAASSTRRNKKCSQFNLEPTPDLSRSQVKTDTATSIFPNTSGPSNSQGVRGKVPKWFKS